MFIVIAYSETSFAQKEMSPHQQWKKFADIDMLTCKPGYLLILKSDGNPLCVMPDTYLKLVDRGYGSYDSSIMGKRSVMQSVLMQNMMSNSDLMHHWHEMMQKSSASTEQTAVNWISQIQEKPDLLKNVLDPIASDPKLRLAMIDAMKKHSHMEVVLKQHSGWMDSVHHPVINSEDTNEMSHFVCAWCTEYQTHTTHESLNKFANPDRMMVMIHEIWVNSEMSQDLHLMMLENPSHMRQMSEQMMGPVLGLIMDDEQLRLQMIDLLLEHRDFMNAIRHDDPKTKH